MKIGLGIAVAVLLSILISVQCLAQRSGERRSRQGALKVGGAAPDFNLKRLGGKGTVKLSSFKGKEPVALIFGSYT